MRGRKPIPTRLKVLNGNPGQRPLNEGEPKPALGIPSAPPHLDGEALAEWDRVTAELHAIDLLTVADRPSLACYCVAWARWVQAETELAVEGPVLTAEGTGNSYQNPWLAVANRAMEQVRQFSALFGLDPSSRCRLDVRPQGKEEDAIDQFLQGNDPAP